MANNTLLDKYGTSEELSVKSNLNFKENFGENKAFKLFSLYNVTKCKISKLTKSLQ